MGTHMFVLGKSFALNTNMTGFRWFYNAFCIVLPCVDESSLSMERDNPGGGGGGGTLVFRGARTLVIKL